MFRDKIVKAIKDGKVEEVKKILEAEPYIVDKRFGFAWPNGDAGLLHIAAYFNQPEIIKYLAEINKQLNINNQNAIISYSALHFAAETKSSDAVKALLTLGANPCLQDNGGKYPYDVCKDQELKKLLYTAYQEWQVKKEAPKAAVKEEQSVESVVRPTEQEEQASDRLKGIWTKSEASDEVIFERDMPRQNLRLTETFNFAAELRILIAANLETGDPSQPETKTFSEIPKRAEQARAAFAKLSDAASDEPVSVKNHPKLNLNNLGS